MRPGCTREDRLMQRETPDRPAVVKGMELPCLAAALERATAEEPGPLGLAVTA